MSRLTDAELFVLCAARVYRARRESPLVAARRSKLAASSAPRAGRGLQPSRCPCLPQLFEAVGLRAALPAFLQFQIALSADPDRSITFEDRHTRYVGDGEMALLQALYAWQCDPACDAQSVLWFIRVRTIRRVAADAGREFALKMAAAGWTLPLRGRYWSTTSAWPRRVEMHRIARGVH